MQPSQKNKLLGRYIRCNQHMCGENKKCSLGKHILLTLRNYNSLLKFV